MIHIKPTYSPFGSSGILMTWKEELTDEVSNYISKFHQFIEKNEIEEILEINTVYTSLLVLYKNNIGDKYYEKINALDAIRTSIDPGENFYRTWEIPVCYDREFGIDLEDVSHQLKISSATIIELHQKPIYKVFGLGFLPGFLYLGGLPEALHFKRREHPRISVPKGAVGIGGLQTGVYPNESPGGWNIIGRTPVDLFNIQKKPPIAVQMGDKVIFKAISKETFHVMKDIGLEPIEKHD